MGSLGAFPSNGQYGGIEWSEGDSRIVAQAGAIPRALDGLSRKERSDYSITRALLSMAGDTRVDAALEIEVSQTLTAAIGRPAARAGMFIPTRLNPRMASGLDTKTNAAGKYTVATEVRDLIELLRNKMRVVQLGAKYLTGLQGNLQFPAQATSGTLVWTGEDPGSDVTQVDLTFGVRTMSPKTCQATTAFSRQLLAQSTIDVEALVRLELATIHALGIDLAAIAGTGNSNQPLGILKVTGIGSVTMGASGGAPTAGKITDLETAIATANADDDGMGYLTTPVMRGKLKKIGKLDSVYASLPLWDQWGDAPGVGDLNGYKAMASNQVPSNLSSTDNSNHDCHAIIFGVWPSVVIGEWGVLELTVDPYSLKRQGLIEVTSFQLVDVLLRHPEQMAAILDARNV